MNDFHIKFLDIRNYKSIRNLRLDCKKVNVFLGKPNVGKSNILEALSLLSENYNIQDFIRFNAPHELFWDFDTVSPVTVSTDKHFGAINFHPFEKYYFYRLFRPDIFSNNSFIDSELYEFLRQITTKNDANLGLDGGEIKEDLYGYQQIELDGKSLNVVKNHLDMSKGKGFFNIYPYKYKNDLKDFDTARANPYNLGSAYQLDMPNGKNLPQVIANTPKLAMKLGSYFEEYGLQFMLDKVENKLFVVKAEENTFIKFNYHSIADTLKRRIFYYVAMATNKNKVLLFEEPEAHFFPPYILDLTQQIVDDVTNQFFIATHSPYLLEKIIESTSFNDLNIVVCDYQNHETKIKILREKEIEHLLDMGESVFFNLDYFFEE